ncbi:hypothetical protein [Nonomuraea rubra]|uniref:Uncharacterized protein n=1 Tax=Nonomuraea rubra TaxID=46180 RepID=A0A7X0NUP5_9ACTN|nr:hypothetical protein [Nonomuraea rubra]MBB6549984.1 hypothetical protein [Nonomuraea rubra]
MTIWAFDAAATAALSPTSGSSPGCGTPTTTACATSRRGDRWFTTPGDYHAGLARLLRADARRAGAGGARRPARGAAGGRDRGAGNHTRWFTEVGTGRPGQDSAFFRDADAIAAALLARP